MVVDGWKPRIFHPPSDTQKENRMLVLNRKLGETIVIGGAIRITVLDIDRGKIKLGIDAPLDVPIMREELCKRPLQAAAQCKK
jgi:carbon storage regulator